MIFTLKQKDKYSNARLGEIQLAHGTVKTPIFMPVGTQGTVKALQQEEIDKIIHAEIILANTYHMYLRPGVDIINAAGGIHDFIAWDKPILTDSGGYQVYSLSGMRKINEEGVKFASHIDGSKHLFTPENVMDIQRNIGADIIMAFDECTPYPCEKKYAQNSMHMTHRWLDRCIDRFNSTSSLYNYRQELVPIIQGSVYNDLRKQSAEYIASKGTAINAIGGLSVGEPHDMMYGMTEEVCKILPESSARYLMGVGLPENVLESIGLGIDMFDCVLPTRNARHGLLYTLNGVLNLKNAKWKTSFDKIDENSSSPLSQKHTRAYLHHLFRVKEYYGASIASLHNLCFYLDLVRAARKHIQAGDFKEWKDNLIPQLRVRL